MLVSPSRIHYSSLESLEGFFQLFRDIRWWVQWWQYDRKKNLIFLLRLQASIFWQLSAMHMNKEWDIFAVGYLTSNFFFQTNFKCILSLLIPQHHKIDKVSFDISEISLLMMLSFWTCYQSFLDTYWHFNLLASEVKPSVLVYSIKMICINICHVCM